MLELSNAGWRVRKSSLGGDREGIEKRERGCFGVGRGEFGASVQLGKEAYTPYYSHFSLHAISFKAHFFLAFIHILSG